MHSLNSPVDLVTVILEVETWIRIQFEPLNVCFFLKMQLRKNPSYLFKIFS